MATRKSRALQLRVVTKKIVGKSNREIAQEEHIDRATVGRILSGTEYQEIIRTYRQEVLDLISGSVRAFRTALDGIDVPEGLAPKTEQIEVLDGDDLKKRMERAYKKGLAAGMDAVKVATEVLKGTQVLVTKQDVNAKVEDETKRKSPDELRAEVAKELQALVDQGRLQPPL